MIYKFKSKAAGDVIMLGPQGDRLLRLLGREPAAQGIFEPAALPAMVATLEGAIRAAEAAASRAAGAGATPDAAAADDAGLPGESPLTLRQRLWPMVEMMRRAADAREPIVWGV